MTCSRDYVVTLDLEDPPRTIHIIVGSAQAPDDGNRAFSVHEMRRILDSQPTPAQFRAILDQDLDDLDLD